MEESLVVIALAAIIATPAYYVGKVVQRADTLYDCQHYEKTNLEPLVAKHSKWIDCTVIEPPVVKIINCSDDPTNEACQLRSKNGRSGTSKE